MFSSSQSFELKKKKKTKNVSQNKMELYKVKYNNRKNNNDYL